MRDDSKWWSASSPYAASRNLGGRGRDERAARPPRSLDYARDDGRSREGLRTRRHSERSRGTWAGGGRESSMLYAIKYFVMYDTAAIGAGLAGLCSARILGSRGLRLLLVDRNRSLADGIHTT